MYNEFFDMATFLLLFYNSHFGVSRSGCQLIMHVDMTEKPFVDAINNDYTAEALAQERSRTKLEAVNAQNLLVSEDLSTVALLQLALHFEP